MSSSKKWKKISRSRKLYNHPSGFAIIVPLSQTDRIPAECPVCKFIMHTADDVESFKMFSCCQKCEMAWARARQQEWEKGWRPSFQQLKVEKCKRQKKLP